MPEALLTNTRIELGVLVVILGLFIWLLKWTMNENKRREEAHYKREQEFMVVLGKLSAVVERQGESLNLLSREMSNLTVLVDKLKSEMSRIWEKISPRKDVG